MFYADHFVFFLSSFVGLFLMDILGLVDGTIFRLMNKIL